MADVRADAATDVSAADARDAATDVTHGAAAGEARGTSATDAPVLVCDLRNEHLPSLPWLKVACGLESATASAIAWLSPLLLLGCCS
jgi:hypothetical protein